MAVGNRIFLKRHMIKDEVIKEFETIPTANVADCIGRLVGMYPRISLQSNPIKSVSAGRALTVKTRAGDNLLIHKALDMVQPGDVIVVSNDTGDGYRSLMGIIMFTLAMQREVAGIVVDGPIRDVDMVKTLSIPIYATGSNPSGPYKDGTGEINVPISCGGMTVAPGDLIVMDADGVIVVPYQDVETVLPLAKEFQRQDMEKLEAMKLGQGNRSWIDKKLAQQETEIIDGIF